MKEGKDRVKSVFNEGNGKIISVVIKAKKRVKNEEGYIIHRLDGTQANTMIFWYN